MTARCAGRWSVWPGASRTCARPCATSANRSPILHPQEIWEQWEWIYALEIMALRRRYIALWDVGDLTRPGLTVFEFTPKRFWSGVTAFVPEDNEKRSWQDYLADQRSGHMRWPK